MKGAHLIPKNEMEGKPQGLTGAEVTDVNYDPIINMTYEEYEDNLSKIMGGVQSIHQKLSDVVMGLIAMGALTNAWNPVGAILAGVAMIVGLLNALGIFDDKAAWDKDRTGAAWDKISNYYEHAVLGKRTGEMKNGKPVFTGGLSTMASATKLQDELVQTLMNNALKGLAIYEAVFADEANKSWKSNVSEKNTAQLARLSRSLRENFIGKIRSYEKVYHIGWTTIRVSLADGIFDEDFNNLGIGVHPIGHSREVAFDLNVIQLKRKEEYIGMGLTFTDFNDAASGKAAFFESQFASKEGRDMMFTLGLKLIETLKLNQYLTSDEAEYYGFKNWYNNAVAFDKATYNNGWDIPYNQKIHRVTEPMHADNQCRNMGLVLSDFIDKRGEYKNATAQDLLKLLKAAKARHNKFNIPGKGVAAPNCHQLSARDMPKVLTAFKAFGLNPNDYDDNFDFRKIASLPSPSDPSGQSSNFTQNSGLITPDGYTDEHPYNPLRREPARPSPPNQGQNQGQSQETKPSTPALQPQATPQATPEPAPSTPGGDKKKSLWWIWLLVAAGGLYMITKKEKKNGN